MWKKIKYFIRSLSNNSINKNDLHQHENCIMVA